jgi:hypothetical protein
VEGEIPRESVGSVATRRRHIGLRGSVNRGPAKIDYAEQKTGMESAGTGEAQYPKKRNRLGRMEDGQSGVAGRTRRAVGWGERERK